MRRHLHALGNDWIPVPLPPHAFTTSAPVLYRGSLLHEGTKTCRRKSPRTPHHAVLTRARPDHKQMTSTCTPPPHHHARNTMPEPRTRGAPATTSRTQMLSITHSTTLSPPRSSSNLYATHTRIIMESMPSSRTSLGAPRTGGASARPKIRQGHDIARPPPLSQLHSYTQNHTPQLTSCTHTHI